MPRSRHGILVVAVALLVVLAGCQAPFDTAGGETTTAEPNETPTDTAPENPWNADTITVAVEADLSDRDYADLARPAIEAWNDGARTELDTAVADPPRLELVESTESADVVLHYTPLIAQCHSGRAPSEQGFHHCAPELDANASVHDQLVVPITSQYRSDATTDITLNAIASLFGGAEPRSVESPELLDPFPRTDTVTVGIKYVAKTDRNITPLVEEAVEYWMANDDEYGTYTTDWEVVPDAEDPDVVVLYVDTIVRCGFGPDQDYYIGCTDLLTTEESANTPVQVEIAKGYDDASTINTIKHEFGHLYGLEHGDEPMPLMSATGDAVPLNETEENSTEASSLRAVAW